MSSEIKIPFILNIISALLNFGGFLFFDDVRFFFMGLFSTIIAGLVLFVDRRKNEDV